LPGSELLGPDVEQLALGPLARGHGEDLVEDLLATSAIDAPSRIVPQSRSMSSVMWR